MDAQRRAQEDRINEIARAHWGVISRAELLACGLSRHTIRRRAASGRLRELFPGAYALGAAEIAWEGTAYAALLCVGPGAFLSHETAAGIHRVLDPWLGWPHVTSERRTGHSPAGIIVHRVRALPPSMRMSRLGLQVTTVERTLLDLAAAGTPEPTLQRAMNEAEYLQILDADLLAEMAATSRKGCRALRRAIDRRAPTRSWLEDEFFGRLIEAELPVPLANWRIGPYQVDFLWPDERLIVETDGWAAHGGAGGQARDRRKDAYLESRGHRVMRVARARFRAKPAAVIAEVAAALAAPDHPKRSWRTPWGGRGAKSAP